MKKILSTVLFLVFSLYAFSQNTANNKDYYLKKSKHQKTAFYVLAGTGTGLIITGLAWGPKNADPEKQDFTPGFLLIGGVVSCIVSIPILIASNKNKKRSMSFSFKNEPSRQLLKRSFVYRSIPSITLKFQL